MLRAARILLVLLALAGAARGQDRLRVIVETDAGGDPDDEQSLVRFLLYANEWDVEGIIANRPHARARENLNPERTGLGIVRRELRAYGRVYPRLSENAPGYPTEAALEGRTVAGYSDTDDGVNLVIRAVDRDDPRPVWFLNWGTDWGSDPSSLQRALDRVLGERGREGYARFKDRIRLSSSDRFRDHTTSIRPFFRLWVEKEWPLVDGEGWSHRFGFLTATAGGFDLRRDVLTGHGPLGALYPANTNIPQKEGDSLTFLYLIPTGMNDPMHPEWGSWAGRFGVRTDFYRQVPAYYGANVADRWQGTASRENTLRRWAADLQNDFRARLDWCVLPYARANHRPRAVLNGDGSGKILTIPAAAGSAVRLSARGSSDPDGNALSYAWIPYPEAGGYAGTIPIAGAAEAEAVVAVPPEAAGHDLHVILAVRDGGHPALTAYRRAILRVLP
ncbi:MAG TPA: nucleoside hydrolase-like domain-containing protein [Opitutaceae bacterium]|nr:nucleoside hydrolase-like domain-containing protein [Opitutaceae bacterium]